MSQMPIRHIIAALAAVAMLIAGGAVASAQVGTATPGPSARGAAYPVSVHVGTCENPVAQPVGPTVDTKVAGMNDDSEFIGIGAQAPVLVAKTDLDGVLDDYTGTPHVVAVHASAEEYGTIVACGEIAGYAKDDTLVFALRSVSGAQVSGIAVLSQGKSLLDQVLEEIDDSVSFSNDTVHLTVYIIPGNEADSGT